VHLDLPEQPAFQLVHCCLCPGLRCHLASR
jgi:hypothetical protein